VIGRGRRPAVRRSSRRRWRSLVDGRCCQLRFGDGLLLGWTGCFLITALNGSPPQSGETAHDERPRPADPDYYTKWPLAGLSVWSTPRTSTTEQNCPRALRYPSPVFADTDVAADQPVGQTLLVKGEHPFCLLVGRPLTAFSPWLMPGLTSPVP
jgi:hypothetical protein